MSGNSPFLKHFSSVPDPRSLINRKHLLLDILFIALCAVICGAKGWNEIEEFGKSRQEWLKKYLLLPNGIPSHDTFREVFLFLDPCKFNESFSNWISEVAGIISGSGENIAIDGKTSRHSFSNKTKPLHLVSAWASKNSLVLGQIKVDEKSNEITAIPKILKALDVKGCMITIDAMGCQKSIAKQISEAEGDYALALKGNQGKIHEQIKDYMEASIESKFEDIKHETKTTIEKDHGRIETRKYYLINDLNWLEGREEWPSLRSVGLVISKRKIGEKTTIENRYYLTSLKSGVERFAEAVRSHWGIENSLHWVLDVRFNEDQCRKREGNSPENFAVLRHLALNLLRKEKTNKGSIAIKQFKAALSEKYLEVVIQS
ncbi:MAG: ISAs1 family transposase [Candidatus Riflebacteria bacterium]|nr:ISAs1 family transposase [Candidatus Riflebacteria bacterium]